MEGSSVVGAPSEANGHELAGGASVATAAEQQAAFGRLEPVRIRDHWKDEAKDFTPWLAEEANLALLGETIGSNLQLVGTEQRVGPFRADVIARDENGHLVVIENQLGATDHGHLGQLLVYAAGQQARTVVWIAKQVTDEYRKVIDWLNQETSTRFWALEIELWQIGDSAVAPKFNVAGEPNELTQSSGDEDSGELTERRAIQLEFWKAFSDHLDSSGSSFNSRKPFPRNWYDLSIGTSRARVSLVLRPDEVSCEFYIPNSESSVIYAALESERETIEQELGDVDVDWQPLPERDACRLAITRPGDYREQDQWPELFGWLQANAEVFKSVLTERVKRVVLPAAA
jgi:Domain of unknown function (DUF4268)